MIKAIGSNDNITTFCSNPKQASNIVLAELHYRKFLRAEDKFYKSTEDLETHMDSWSLKTPYKAAKAIKDFCKMGYEKLASVYYLQKK